MYEAVRRRKRSVISCTLCRRRKIRCNRETPCSNCIRSKTAVCVYEAGSPVHGLRAAPQSIQPRLDVPPIMSSNIPRSSWDTAASSTQYAGSATSSFEIEAMGSRIAELEEKLSRAGSSTAPSSVSVSATSPAPAQPVETMTSLAGVIDVLPNTQDTRTFGRTTVISRAIAHKNRVFGQSHWMNGFMVYRDLIELIEPHMRSQQGSSMLADMHRAKVLARAIKNKRSPTWPTTPDKELPPREICDQLIDAYLRTIETLYRTLHVPSFRQEYENIWVSEMEPNMPFVVQLKLVFAIGALFLDNDFSMRVQATHWIYEAQTWLSSPTFKSSLGIQYLQTHVLLLLARDFVDVGSELVWISAGSVVRTAIYIGLHKDPSKLPRMTPFESEMRRRLWNTILEISLQSSLESGGPALISMDDFDTASPGNFDDAIITTMDADTPSSTAATQTSVSIALRSSFAARLAVVKFLNANSSAGTFEGTLRLDAELRAAIKRSRRTLQGHITSGPISSTLFNMQAVDFIMHRYVSALHQPLFGVALRNPIYAYSRKAVVDASMSIWRIAHRSLQTSPEIPESDFSRLCRCGSGFFRAFAFHAATFVGADVRARIEDEEEDFNTFGREPSSMRVIADAAQWYLRCMEAGETGLKGHLLLQLLAAQIDGIRRRISMAELPNMLTEAAAEATATCLRILEAKAGTEQSADDAGRVDEFGFQISPELTEDWDKIMSDVFNFGTYGDSFDFFSIQ